MISNMVRNTLFSARRAYESVLKSYKIPGEDKTLFYYWRAMKSTYNEDRTNRMNIFNEKIAAFKQAISIQDVEIRDCPLHNLRRIGNKAVHQWDKPTFRMYPE